VSEQVLQSVMQDREQQNKHTVSNEGRPSHTL